MSIKHDRHQNRSLSFLNLSDDELRLYEFAVPRPEEVVGYRKDRPTASDMFLGVIKSYDIPHPKRSRSEMAWCAFCQEENHHKGVVASYSGGIARSVGWCCARDKLGVVFKHAHRDFIDARVRKSYLLWFDELSPVLNAALEQAAAARKSPSLYAFVSARDALTERMQGLWKFVVTAAIQKNGQLQHERRITLHDESPSGRRERQGFAIDRYDLRGALFADLRVDPMRTAAEIESLLKGCCVTVGEDSSTLDNPAMRRLLGRIRAIVSHMDSFEKVIASLPAFFGPENLSTIAQYRNLTLSRPAYRAQGTALIHDVDGTEPVTVRLPNDYQPFRFSIRPRLEALLKEA